MGKLEGKVAIVTGAGAGIGRAIAEKLAAEGASVVATDVDADAADATAAVLGGDSIGLAMDVTDRDGVVATVTDVHQRFGRIDVLANNAGLGQGGPVRRVRPGRLGPGATDQPLRSPPHLSRRAADHGVQGHGAVVNIGSDAGRVGSSGEAVYSAAKGGVIAFTKSAARELARHHVRLNCVCPGPTDTALFASMGGEGLRQALVKAIPFRRRAEPADIANAVAFYASDEAAYITGQTVSVSGGLTMS